MEKKRPKFIVITSIFEPTEAVQLFAGLNGYSVIVVGDKKTPPNWQYPGVRYLSIECQMKTKYRLANELPYNHYCRKMVGYLTAIELGAELIVDTDDDNIPKSNWSSPVFDGSYQMLAPDQGFINIYQAYTGQKIWPRGLPLRLINETFRLADTATQTKCIVGVWQGLADEDPDVDAIYRLTDGSPCHFNAGLPCVLGKRTITPFNSQNTFFRKELFPLLYLPTTVTFRFTDILRAWVAQPIMWLFNYSLGFTEATVIQKRNPHDYMKDFVSEMPMYEQTEKAVDTISNALSETLSIEENMVAAYTALYYAGIVAEKELQTLQSWLHDFSQLKQIQA